MVGRIARRRISNRGRRPGVEGLESRRLMAFSIAEFPVPTLDNTAITVFGGNLWFTGRRVDSANNNVPVIGMLNPTTGATARYDVPTGPLAIQPEGLTAGKDGNLWFTVPSPGAGAIGLFSPTLHTSAFAPTPTPNSNPVAITSGLDGTLWFTEQAAGKIGSFNPVTATFHEYPLPNAASKPTGIVTANDGSLWFTETANGVDRIGRVDPTTGHITEFDASGPVSSGLAVGPDGQVWFGESNSIAEINTATHVITAYPASVGTFTLPSFATGAFGIAPDGNVVFATYLSAPHGFAASYFLGEINVTTHAVSYTLTPQTAPVNPFNPDSITKVPVGSATYYVASGTGVGAATPVPAGQSAVSGVVSLANTNTPESGRTVYVDLNNDGVFNPGEPSAVTAGNGYYSITGVAPGAYPVRVTSLPGDVFVDLTGKVAPAQTVAFTSGGSTLADTIFIQPTSPILPLTLLNAPFGASNPDVSTAEVTGLYNIILGRAPDAPGLAFWVNALNSSTLTLAQEASLFLHSTAYQSRAVASYYRNYLGRTAAPQEIAGWVSYMQQGHSEEDVAQLFLSGAPYNALHPNSAEFIQSIYGNVLGRVGTPAEVVGWLNYLNNGGSRAVLVHSAIVAADTTAVQGFDAIFLGTAPSAGFDNVYIAALQSGLTLADVATAFASSQAYVQRANATVV